MRRPLRTCPSYFWTRGHQRTCASASDIAYIQISDHSMHTSCNSPTWSAELACAVPNFIGSVQSGMSQQIYASGVLTKPPGSIEYQSKVNRNFEFISAEAHTPRNLYIHIGPSGSVRAHLYIRSKSIFFVCARPVVDADCQNASPAAPLAANMSS